MAATHARNQETAGLADYYACAGIERCDDRIDPDLEIAWWMAREERRRNRRPTVLFTNVAGHPQTRVLGNPYPRAVLLASLRLAEADWQTQLAARLAGAAPGLLHAPAKWRELPGLDSLPILRHRPGDAGKYITSGVAVTSPPGETTRNLGVYRIQVVTPRRCRIFFDPKTDAHHNLLLWRAAGKPMPVTVFLGAHPAHILAGASRFPAAGDDFRRVAQMLDTRLVLDPRISAPADAEIVIVGEVGSEEEWEGPFAEFKGYYVEPRLSPVLRVEAVLAAENPLYPAIVTGAESGLTLMAMQNEFLMYEHLRASGFSVIRVSYPLDALGEFLCLVQSPAPSTEMVAAAMAFDQRSKVVICGSNVDDPWRALATRGFQVRTDPYIRKNRVEGERAGFLLDAPPQQKEVEF